MYGYQQQNREYESVAYLTCTSLPAREGGRVAMKSESCLSKRMHFAGFRDEGDVYLVKLDIKISECACIVHVNTDIGKVTETLDRASDSLWDRDRGLWIVKCRQE